jgi:squalene-associated FAD-dependent desaturase
MTTQKTDCLIVGGGLAGLTCAVALAEKGLSPWVLESSERLGGRAQSWKDEKTGDAVDLGPHILLSVYSNMLAFLKRLGTDHLIHWQTDGVIHQVSGTETYTFAETALPSPMHLLPSIWNHPKIGAADLVSIRHIVSLSLGLSEREIHDYDSMTAAELIQRAGSSTAMKELLWDFISMSLLNLPSEEASATAFLRVVRYFSGTKNLLPGLAKVGLGELFADQSVKKIEAAKGKVLLRTRAASVDMNADGSGVVTLDDGSKIEARTVVLALAPQDLAKILRPEQQPPGLDKFETCPYLSVYLWFEGMVSDRAFWARTYHPEDLNCDFYDLSRFRKGYEGRGSVITSNIIYSNRVSSMSNEDVMKATRRELEEHLPRTREAKLLHWRVNRVPMAIHCPRPGTESLRPAVRPEGQSYLLAGDWVKTGLPSSMESACHAGFLAAEEVLRAVRPAPSQEKLALPVRGPGTLPHLLARGFATVMNSGSLRPDQRLLSGS